MQVEIAFAIDFIGILTMCMLYIQVESELPIPCEGNVRKRSPCIRKPIVRARSIRDRS